MLLKKKLFFYYSSFTQVTGNFKEARWLRWYSTKISHKITYKRPRKFLRLTASELLNNIPNDRERPFKLNPYFVTGFCDAECSFTVRVEKSQGYRTGWGVNPVFQITLHEKDLKLLSIILGGRGDIS